MKIGICAWVLPGEALNAFAKAREFGLQGIVLDYGDPIKGYPLKDKATRDVYRKEAIKYNVEITTLAINDFCRRGMIQDENSDYAKRTLYDAIEIASKMGIYMIQVPSFYNNLIRTEVDLDRTIEIFNYACKIGQDYNVRVASESVMTVDQYKKFYKGVRSDYLATIFDTQNPWRMMSQDGIRIAEYVKPFVHEIHAKDSLPVDLDFPEKNKGLGVSLGDGDVKYSEIIDVLIGKNFDGWIQLESPYNEMMDYVEVLKEDINRIGQYIRK